MGQILGCPTGCRSAGRVRRESIAVGDGEEPPEVAESALQEMAVSKNMNLTKVNQYKIEVMLGSGAYGSVYRAGACRHRRYARTRCSLTIARCSGREGPASGNQGAQPRRPEEEGEAVSDAAHT